LGAAVQERWRTKTKDTERTQTKNHKATRKESHASQGTNTVNDHTFSTLGSQKTRYRFITKGNMADMV
jgi:hypothetical protein